jgi:hypothetical protein
VLARDSVQRGVEMVRALIGGVLVAALFVGGLEARDKQVIKEKVVHKPFRAKVVRVDGKKNVVVLRRTVDGKEIEKRFTFHKDTRFFDHAGKTATIEVFRPGNEVMITERDGRIIEMRPHGKRVIKERIKRSDRD